jgi:hypothetical protein
LNCILQFFNYLSKLAVALSFLIKCNLDDGIN